MGKPDKVLVVDGTAAKLIARTLRVNLDLQALVKRIDRHVIGRGPRDRWGKPQ